MAKTPHNQPKHHFMNPTLGKGFHAVRPIASASIGALLGNLKHLRSSDRHKDEPIHIGVQNPESGPGAKLFTRGFLGAMHLQNPDVQLHDVYSKIKSNHPSTTRRIEYATMDDIDVWKSGDSVYVGATFNQTTAAKLRAEQEEMLEIAAKLGDGDLEDVRMFQPKALIAVIGEGALAGTVSEVIQTVEKHLPTKVELLPVNYSHQLARGHAARSAATPNRSVPMRPASALSGLEVQGKTDGAMVGTHDVHVDISRYDLAA